MPPPSTPRSGAFSPPLSSAASYTANIQSRLNIVSRLAIEGKAKQNADGASIKLYLKITVPVDSVTSGQIIPIFAEENIKIKDYSVHPLDSDSVPYNFSSTSHPLLHNAARALNLPARSSKSYLSLFDSTPHSTPGRNGSVNSSAVPALEERYTGYFLISGYNVCYVLPKETPMKYKMRGGGTDSEGDVRSARATTRTPSYGSGSSGRRQSVGERNSIQFMAGMLLWVPFSSRPPKAPYMLSIPIPRCLSNNIKVRLPSPSSISTSFASLESEEDSSGWDLATEPHVTRTSSSKHSSRTSAYNEFADDESSEASVSGSIQENCMVQGTFPSSDTIRIRWAAPSRSQDLHGGRRRVGVDTVEGNMTCTVLESREEGVKMRLDYQGTCHGIWHPGVATMLGMDIQLDTQGSRLTWPPDSDGQWTIDGDPALTGFTVGLPQTGLSQQNSLELPQPDASGLLGETIPKGPMRNHHSDVSTSLLRAPLPNRRFSAEYSFEDSLNGTSVPSIATSAIHSSLEQGLGSASESFARPPTTPVVLHINMNELAPGARNKLTINVSGTVLVAPGPGMLYVTESGNTTLPLPLFRVFDAAKENIDTTVRNQCDGASVELINSGLGSGSASRSGSSHGGSQAFNPGASGAGSRTRKTVVPSGAQVKCPGLEGSEILVKQLAPKSPMKIEELSPTMRRRSNSAAAGDSRPSSPEPVSAVLRSQGARSMGFRDGPLVIPWVNADVVPLISSPSLSSSTTRKSASHTWSYAVTVSLPTPVDGPSDWLEFGLALPPGADSSEKHPRVEVRGASVNGVPVRCEAFPHARAEDLSASTSSVGGGSIATVGAADADAGAGEGKTTWLSWVRVHVALAGALEVVYVVKGQEQGRALSDKKGKRKAGVSGEEVAVFVPVFSIPVTRFEISLRRSSDVTIPKPDALGGSSSVDYTLHRKISTYDVPPFTHSHADLTIPHPSLMSKAQPSQAQRSAKRMLLALVAALPYVLALAVLTHTIGTRRELRELRALVPAEWPDAQAYVGQTREGAGGTETVTTTVTQIVSATESRRSAASREDRRWFGDTYTMSYSAPTQKAGASSKGTGSVTPSPIPSVRAGDREEDEVIIEDVSDSPDDTVRHNSKHDQESEDEPPSESEGSSLLPIMYLPLWPAHIHYEQAKAQVIGGWGRVWRVVEIILHWPLPVDDA